MIQQNVVRLKDLSGTLKDTLLDVLSTVCGGLHKCDGGFAIVKVSYGLMSLASVEAVGVMAHVSLQYAGLVSV